MKWQTFLGGGAFIALAAACGYTGSGIDPGGGAPARAVDGTEPTTDAAGAGLPCDVAQVLADACQACHGEPLAGDAPNRLTTRSDLMARPDTDPTRTVAELAIARMRDTAKPMPPTGALPEASIAILESWVESGYPEGTCTDSSSSSATVCTSDTYWTRGDHESPLMHPGGACIDCHTKEREGPSFTAAGTLYPTLHEPTDCNGTTAASIVIMDSAGKTVLTLKPNSAGNFYSEKAIPSPYRAKVLTTDGKVREMATAQTDGDCNGCHTEKGANKAPGRVRTP